MDDFDDDLDDLDNNLFGGSLNAKKDSFLTKQIKKNQDFDEDDPLAGLLSDDENSKEEKAPVKKPTVKKALEPKQPPAPAAKSPSNRGNRPVLQKTVDFGEDDDDILGGLGLENDSAKAAKKTPTTGVSFMDSLLGDSNKKPSSNKEFILRDSYKKKESEFAYTPTPATNEDIPRRRREPPKTSATSYSPSFETSTLGNESKPVGKTSASEPRASSSGRRRGSATNLDWLGFGSEESKKNDGSTKPRETPRNGERNPETPKTDTVDWLGGNSNETDNTTKVKQNSQSFDWMDLRSKSKSDVRPTTAPEVTTVPEITLSTTEITQNISKPQGNGVIDKVQDLTRASEISTLHHKEQVESLEIFYKNQRNSLEDLHKETEKRLKKDFETRFQHYRDQISRLESEKTELQLTNQEKVERIERENRQEVERLKELQKQSILSLKDEHQDALKRLQRLKEQEIDAISSTQNQSRSLQQVMDELQSKTLQLQNFQEILEGKHQDALKERQAVLEEREKSLKALEVRLLSSQKDWAEEKVRLQELVVRLEKRLQEQTRHLEEERWQVLQEKGRLEAKQKALKEDSTELEERLERDRTKLHEAKELILKEQRSMLSQVAQERKLLADQELQLRRKEEELNRTANFNSQIESKLESDGQRLKRERRALEDAHHQLKQDTGNIARERLAMESEKDYLRSERDKLQDLAVQVKKRSEEIEEMCLNAVKSREEGHGALLAARRLEESLNEKRQHLGGQLQELQAKEQKIMQERGLLSEERKRLESTRLSITCAKCKMAPYRHFLPADAIFGSPVINDVPKTLPNHMDEPSILIWKVIAERVR